MIPRRSLLAILFISVLGFLAFVPKDDDPLDKLVASLRQWADDNPQEKVYLHMDKPYYALGDTIWFKAYVTTGSRHQLSAISGAVYADLINDKDSVVKSLKLPLTAGTSMGDFTIDYDLKEGNYRIRAYTQWMRNAGAEYFFDHTFVIGSAFDNGVIGKAAYQYKNVDGKQLLTAFINYTDNAGVPLAKKDITCELIFGSKVLQTKNRETDTSGNLSLVIPIEKQGDLNGGVIRTTLLGADRTKFIKEFPIKVDLSQSDVQFFPESGNLIYDVVSRVGFKAIGIEGNGLIIKGSIVDNEQKHIVDFASIHAGMGSFILRPEAGKTYIAEVVFEDGTQKSVPLPKPNELGYVLSVFQPNRDSILVRVSTSAKMIASTEQKPLTLNFIAQSGGETIMASPVKITRASTSFWLEKSAFPSGIAQFTLFDETGIPINERIAFIKRNDQMRLSLSTTKKTYKSKERVELELEARDSNDKLVAGNFSVTVVDETKVPFEQDRESTIFSNLLLTSDLKGYIEKPNYYFISEGEEVNAALDNLMLTQGYRRFLWKDISSGKVKEPVFKAEGLATYISGRVFTLAKKPAANAKMTLLSVRAGMAKGATTDAEGRFTFEGLFLADSVKFAVQARTQNNKNKLEVILDSVPELQVGRNKNIGDLNVDLYRSTKAYTDNSKKQDELLDQMGGFSRTRRLKEVNIRARAYQKSLPKQRNYNLNGPGKYDQILKGEELNRCTNLANCLSGRFAGVYFKKLLISEQCPPISVPCSKRASSSIGIPGPLADAMLLVLDGMAYPISDPANCGIIGAVFDFGDPPPNGIVSVEILMSPIYTNVYGQDAKNGVILVTTKNGGNHEPAYNPSVVNTSPKSFDRAKEFYSPRYDRPGSNMELPDLRSTVYWNANVKTYSTGKTTLNYFNADGPGNYKVIVEGINADGELGRQVYRYTVEGDLFKAQGVNTTPAFSSVPEGVAKLVSAGLDSLRKKMPVEKVYLHTDKPYYNIGDTLWFKSYVMDGANFTGSRQSGLLYVELDDDSSEVVRRISIPIKNGLGWGQIPLSPKIFHEGGFTLRAYTNWMQNFGEDYIFSRRFYLGVPRENTWLVQSKAAINRVAEKDQLDVNLKLKRTDQSPVGLKEVEVKIYEGDHWIYNEKMQTTLEGNLQFSKVLKEKADGRNIRVELRSIKASEGNQVLQVPLSINRVQKIDLQFLPESGHLVGGLKSVVGFKAIGEDGKGTAVSGGIYDSKGNEITRFETLHDGMGSFELTPKAGESYIGRVTFENGFVKGYDLPKVEANGLVMHIDNKEESDALAIDILHSAQALNADSLFLVAIANGKMYYTQNIDASTPKLSISKSKFPTGIVKFTLFNGLTPLAERMVFVDHADQLTIKLSQGKASYLKRDSVEMTLEVTDKNGIPVKGSFSVSVTDNSQVQADTAGNFAIGVNLLLSSDLKGTIESPGYYLNRKDKAAWQALDNLMLTQGWTGYHWDTVFEGPAPVKFRAEKEFKITGTVTNLLKKPVSGAPVLISSQKPSFITTVNTDGDGKFVFQNLPKIDSGSFFIQAQTPKGKTMHFGGIELERFKAPKVPETFRDQVLPWYVNGDSTQVNYVRNRALMDNEASLKLKGIGLKEVNIKTNKIIKGSRNRNGPGNADLVFDAADIKAAAVMNLYQLIKQKLPGFRVVYEDGLPTLKYNNYMVVIDIDGAGLPVKLSSSPTVEGLVDALSEFQVAQFIGMEVMYSNKYLYKYVQPNTELPNLPTATEIFNSEYALRSGISENASTDRGVNQLLGLPNKDVVLLEQREGRLPGAYYKVSFRNSNYLEARVNVLTRRTREIAVIAITTGSGKGWSKIEKPDVVTYRPLPVLYPQEFYSPKYSSAHPDIAEPDYRSTLFWEPNITTDANGRAKFSFFTSDSKGTYTIRIEGAGAQGNVGSGQAKIFVK